MAPPATPPQQASDKKNDNQVFFPAGPAGKRELRRALVRSTDPARTIREFQQQHSLHSMMAKAFGTTPHNEYRVTRKSSNTKTVESLDTDSVMTFLSHLGVRQYEVHKRVSDALLKQLEDEIRKSKSKEKLLELLKSCWAYATTLPELRPVLWTVLKQLGEQTPHAVLTALAERESDGKLKHIEIWEPLPPLLKRLCWEADWGGRVPLDDSSTKSAEKSTLLYETLNPLLTQYCSDPLLVDAANRPFVSTARERRVLTKQRRALTSSTSTVSNSGGVASTTTTTTAGLLRSKQASTTSTTTPVSSSSNKATFTSGKAVSQIRGLLSDTTAGSASTFRPKLLYALLSILMAQHGNSHSTSATGGAENLHCTLVADILLSAGGPLPKAYQYVLSLSRLLDDCVQDGNISDEALSRIQSALRQIFQTDEGDSTTSTPVKASSSTAPKKNKEDEAAASETTASSNAAKRQLNRIITAGLQAMKEADPQNLFLNPVTDSIAPGYSKIIRKPMSIVTMEEKVSSSEYNNVGSWEQDVKLMFKNCIDYNRGAAGQWFRGEAKRQANVFKDEIFPQARRMYQIEIAKRTAAAAAPTPGAINTSEDGGGKRKSATDPDITPLPAAVKKRKKEKEEFLPSMPAIACMLLADPFVVRILIDRALRELRRGVMNGTSIPAAHAVLPSLLQLLHMAQWSKKICAARGKKYIIPGAGMDDSNNRTTAAPFSTLRRYLPLLLRLLLETELDKRITLGGDLHAAASATQSSYPDQLSAKSWGPSSSEAGKRAEELQVAVSLVEGALVFVCQPGMGNDTSLSVTYPKFAVALQSMSPTLCQDKPFFICLMQALLKHKSKLPKQTRDAVFECWIAWLKQKGNKMGDDAGSVTSVAHEYLVRMLNNWSALGNLLLPRDTLLQFARDTVQAADSSVNDVEKTCGKLWQSDATDFAPIKQQYERMLKFLPDSQAVEWKQEVGFVDGEAKAPEVEPMEVEEA